MPEEIKAHITGTIWKVLVKPNEEVEEGDDLIILESMKMEMPVECPVDGTVLEVKVEEGQPLEDGQVLAVVEEE